MKKPRGPKRWSKLSQREQYRLRYRRAKWRAKHDARYISEAHGFLTLRNRLGLTQREMATRYNVSLRSYKRWEAGQSARRRTK